MGLCNCFKGQPGFELQMWWLLILALSRYVFCFRFGFLIDDYDQSFEGCSVAEFGVMSSQASERERRVISDSLNNLLRTHWKSRFIGERDPGFKCRIEPWELDDPHPKGKSFAIYGEMNEFMAKLKMTLLNQIDVDEAWDSVNFYLAPMLHCPRAIADKLPQEVTIRLSRATVERNSEEPSIELIDFAMDFGFEVISYDSSGTLDTVILSDTRQERLQKIRNKNRRCCSSCCNIL